MCIAGRLVRLRTGWLESQSVCVHVYVCMYIYIYMCVHIYLDIRFDVGAPENGFPRVAAWLVAIQQSKGDSHQSRTHYIFFVTNSLHIMCHELEAFLNIIHGFPRFQCVTPRRGGGNFSK